MSKKKLITETTFDVSVTTEINEETSKKTLYIEGIFSAADTMVKNGRKYPKKILEREVEKFITEKVKTNTSLGETNHPPRPDVDLNEASIMITELVWKGNDLWGKAKVLSNRRGQDLAALINDGVRVGISSRGLGTVNEQTKTVNEDFELKTWDIVSNPSLGTAWMNGIYEGAEFETKTLLIDEKEEKTEDTEKEEVFTGSVINESIRIVTTILDLL